MKKVELFNFFQAYFSISRSLLLIFILFGSWSVIVSQPGKYVVNQYSVKDGLTQNEVTCITEDKNGFIWFGTRGGLNRFDGYSFKKFKPSTIDSSSITYPSIEAIFADNKLNVWVGTKGGGLSIYSTVYESFSNYSFSPKNRNGISHQRVISFLEDNKGRMWAGTWAGGVNLYNPNKGYFTHFLNGLNARSLLQTRDGKIIAACHGGLWQFNEQKLDFEPIFSDVFSPLSLTKIIEDPIQPCIWVASWSKVLYCLNYKTNEITSYELPSNNSYSLEFFDKNKLWIGTWGKGLYILNTSEGIFEKISLNKHTSNFSEPNVILDIFKDSKNNLWIGTDGQGIFKINEQHNFQNVNLFKNNDNGQSTNLVVNNIFQDSEGKYWVGKLRTLIGVYNENWNYLYFIKQETPYTHNANIIYELNDGKIWIGYTNVLAEVVWENGVPISRNCANLYNNTDLNALVKIRGIQQVDSVIWIGTQQTGLFKLLYSGNEVRVLERMRAEPEKKGKLQSNRISCFLYDSKKRLWVGTYKGLYLLKNDSVFIPVRDIAKKQPSSDLILNINEDKSGNIWFCTPAGLNKFSELENGEVKLEIFTEHEGFSDDYIRAVLIDNHGDAWVSNNIGISKIDIESKKVNNYYKNEGVSIEQFTEGCALAIGDTFYFGGLGGIQSFNPLMVKENMNEPKVVFTNFKLFNNSVHVDEIINGKKLLSASINHTNEIKLPHKFNDLAFEVAALDFNTPERNQYAYKLVGRDNKWIQLGHRRWITFNNLRPGEYELHIIGSNDNNIWSKVARKIKITIYPPWWLTWYALFGCILIIILIVLVIRQVAIKKERLMKNIELLNLKNAKDNELNELKLKFFTNISHEFRTPLSLILGPIQEIVYNYIDYNVSDRLLSKLKIVNRNTKRLMKLVNQLIDFRKIETGNLQLKASKIDLKAFLLELIIPFNELAEINNINFVTHFKFKEPYIWFDREKIDTVLNNLLSNAFKFAAEGGTITFKATNDSECFYLEVVDDGEGIPKEHIKFIFDRFYQIESNKNKYSSGIGLSLVKEFVEMHNGEVEVTSEPNKETRFTVKLMKNNQLFDKRVEEIVHPSTTNNKSATSAKSFIRKIKRETSLPSNKKFELAIIENDLEMINYLDVLLRDKYIVHRAYNGEEGFKLIQDKIPDLVISDIMMSKMDGFELCKMIKEHKKLHYIPVILFTGKDSEHFQLFGSKMGADLYMTKPFNPELLKTNIENLILSRVELKKYFSKKVSLQPKNIEITSYDEQILNKAIKVIEDNLINTELSAEFLAKKLALSQSTLYRKLKSLTGVSISQFIRSIRIKRAAQLLKDEHKTVSEISFEVGINDLKYFRKSFMKEFGMPPFEYRKKTYNQ